MVIINAQGYTAFGQVQVVATAVFGSPERREHTILGGCAVDLDYDDRGPDTVRALEALIQGLTTIRDRQWLGVDTDTRL